VSDVHLDGAFGDKESLADLSVRESEGDKFQDLLFSFG
jgi:hypothetical protein